MIKFWRPQDEYGWGSNFSGHSVRIGDKIYPTTEHLYQAEKAVKAEDHEKIRKIKSPKASKDFAMTVELRPDWEQVKYSVMLKALRLKVEQHDEVKAALLATGDEELVEDSPYDYVWGCGKDGTGTNLLGKAWMEVRAELKKSVTNSKEA